MYSEKVMDHFRNPRNMGEIKEADGIGKVGNPVCGDVMWVYIKVGKNTNNETILEDVKFKTMGCAAAIATSSMVTELAKGKTINEASNLTKQEVADELGGLPAVKLHCSILATDALIEAIYNYLEKNSMEIPLELTEKHERIKRTPHKH
ncbi:MAG: iron-sulfur cluster assembly scaffold protein [Candidatus Diapherotrites archaeon]